MRKRLFLKPTVKYKKEMFQERCGQFCPSLLFFFLFGGGSRGLVCQSSETQPANGGNYKHLAGVFAIRRTPSRCAGGDGGGDGCACPPS